ncbi:MAG TPA: hypothetical protein VJT09_08545 [Pyrinomonadaceae bacterium]|nr:hypothetical protein [Pyrinomonadaceae bacterium]
MADNGVETILQEIKEGVRAEERGARPWHAREDFAGPNFNAHASDPLARLRANLVTTERTWGKLPPVLSFHRRGWKARLEVWVKRQFKRATHWYVYEQINFNGAVNGALHGAAAALEQSLAEQRVSLRQLALEMSEQAVILDRARRAIESRLDDLTARIDELSAVKGEVEQLRSSLAPGGRES